MEGKALFWGGVPLLSLALRRMFGKHVLTSWVNTQYLPLEKVLGDANNQKGKDDKVFRVRIGRFPL